MRQYMYCIYKWITVRRVWIIGEVWPGISPYTCVVNRPGPSSNNKCEPHVEIAYCQDILTCITFPVSVFYFVSLRNYDRNVCSINCPNGILEMGPESRFCKRIMNFGESGII